MYTPSLDLFVVIHEVSPSGFLRVLLFVFLLVRIEPVIRALEI